MEKRKRIRPSRPRKARTYRTKMVSFRLSPEMYDWIIAQTDEETSIANVMRDCIKLKMNYPF